MSVNYKQFEDRVSLLQSSEEVRIVPMPSRKKRVPATSREELLDPGAADCADPIRVIRLVRSARRRQWDLFHDLQAVGLEGDEFTRVVGKNPHGVNVQGGKNLRADSIFPLFAPQSDCLIGIETVFAVIFQFGAAG